MIPINPGGYVEVVLKLLYCLHILGYKISTFLYSTDLEKLVTIRPEQGFMQLEVSTSILLKQSSFCAEQTGSLHIIEHIVEEKLSIFYTVKPCCRAKSWMADICIRIKEPLCIFWLYN